MLSFVDLPTELETLIRDQDGIVTRAQVRSSGVSRGQLRWAVERRWRYVLPEVLATFTGRLDDRQRLVAGCLHAGQDAVITSSTAARWRGLGNVPADPTVRLVVPVLVIASPVRAVADAARESTTSRAAVALVVEAVQRRLVTTAALRHELEGGPRAGARYLRDGLEAVEAGAWSLPEHDLLRALRASRELPEVWANPRLVAPGGETLPTPDGWIDDVALALQVHSRRYHALGDEFEGTVMTDGVFAEYRIPIIGFTPRRIREDPAWVRARVERVYAARRKEPRPPVVATPRDEGIVRAS
jgi:hypothetical protein